MRLKSLKLSGFKSFANPTTFTFQQDITAIVGPNGCGKSNIIDAVRWVLGESSAKQLRGTAMSDVIFAGADGRAGKSLASVDLTFEHTQDEKSGIRHALNLYQELTLRRQVTKEGKSDYFINGQKVRRRDVVDVFLGTGLSTKSYAVIEQGMIGRIVDSSPDELRAFIEEAAGVSRYQARREEAEKQLYQANQNLDRLQDLQGELKKQRSALQEQAKSAKMYHQLNDELNELLWQDGINKIFQLWKTIEEKKSCESQMRNNLADFEQKTADLKQQLDKKVFATADTLTQKDKIKDAYHQASLEAQLAKHTYEQSNQAIDENGQKITEIHNRQKTALAQIGEQKRLIIEQEQKLSQLTPKLDELNQSLEAAQKQSDQNKQAHQSVKYDLNQLFNEKQTWQNAKNTAQANQKQANMRLEKWLKKHQNLHKEQQNFSKQYADYDFNEIPKLEKTIRVLQEDLLQLGEKKTYDNQLDLAERQSSQLQKEIYELEKKQASLQSEHTTVGQWIKQTTTKKPHLKPVWTTLKHKIQLTKDGEIYADVLDGFLQMWLDAAITDDLTHILGEQHLYQAPNQHEPTAILACHQNPYQADKEDLSDLIALDTLIDSPKLVACHRVFLLKSDDTLAKIIQKYHHQLQNGMQILTRFGWLVGSFGVLHINHWQVANDGFLSNQIRHKKRLVQIQDDLNHLTQTLMDKQSQLVAENQNLATLKHKAQDFQQKWMDITKQLHRAKEKQALLGAQMEKKALQEENFIKNMALLEDEKTELDKELIDLDENIRSADQRLKDLMPKLQQTQDELKKFIKHDEIFIIKIKELKDEINQITLDRHTCDQQKNHCNQLINIAQKTADDSQVQLIHWQTKQENEQKNLPKYLQAMTDKEQEAEKLKALLMQLNDKITDLQNQEKSCQENLAHEQQNLLKIRQEHTELKMQIAVSTSRLSDLADQIKQKFAEFDLIKQLKEFENTAPKSGDLNAKIAQLRQKIAQLGAVNLAALAQLQELDEQISPMQKQIQDVTQSMTTLKEAIFTIDKKTKRLFLQMLDAVNIRLNELFVKIFEGGQASLTLLDDETLSKADKWRAGLVLMAQPKGKKNARLSVLSGGEKTLTALSLVFAIFKQHPAPFCLLDEVDAPLDDANVGRFTSLIRELSSDVQFIFISHNKLAMQAAHELKGVTMPQAGISSLVTVNLQEAEQFVKA